MTDTVRSVRVVTDSTASLTAEEISAGRVSVVPLDVVWDGVAWPETELAAGQVVSALRHRKRVTTSRPSPEAFAAVYARLVDDGAAEIVSVHLSADASGTVESARQAARACPVPVHVVDSRQLARGLGYGVLAAVEAITAGADGATAAEAARQVSESSTVVFAVESLEYLRRGGRISLAGAVLGQALAVKPLLEVTDGEISLRERVRTFAKAIERLVAVVEQADAERQGPLTVTVQHLDADDRAELLADRIEELLGHRPSVRPVSAVVGAHTGPGILGVAVTDRLLP